MATLSLTNNIPNSTALIALIASAELETYSLTGTSGLFTYDTDQAVEVDESDVIVNVTGKGMAEQPFPQGTMTGFTVTNLDTGLLWATVTGLPDVDVTQLIILAANSASTAEDYGNLFFGGRDVMTGGATRNIIHGFDGNDQIDGGRGSDKLYGGRGADEINGGAGRDKIYGSRGADSVVFDAELADKNADRIIGFDTARDVMVLDSEIFFNIGDTLDEIELTQSAAATEAEHRIVYDDFTGKLYFDSDGTGAAAQQLFATIHPFADLGTFSFEMLV